jgi:hypothetical protein
MMVELCDKKFGATAMLTTNKKNASPAIIVLSLYLYLLTSVADVVLCNVLLIMLLLVRIVLFQENAGTERFFSISAKERASKKNKLRTRVPEKYGLCKPPRQRKGRRVRELPENGNHSSRAGKSRERMCDAQGSFPCAVIELE